MIRNLIFLTFCVLFTSIGFSQKKTVKITGAAPAYVGKTIDVYRIQDYLTMTEELIGSTTVKNDSTFSVVIPITVTQKIILKANKNKTLLYVQPNATYDVLFPERDKYDPYRPSGNNVELTFFNLDSNDINFKILGFNRWTDDFIGNYFYLKNSRPVEFVKELDYFKDKVEIAYKNDTNTYFKTYVKFTFAQLDEVQSLGSRNKYEKHDFYLKHSTVAYENDVYMNYLIKFYENLLPRLNAETSARVNLGIEKASPTAIMRALGGEYTLVNLRIREVVMIKLLTEEFYKGPSYQGKILTILDSLSNHSLFKNDQIIAKNTIARLQELVPGGKSPEFNLTTTKGEVKTLKGLNGKHVYLHFYNPLSENCRNELTLLTSLYDKYKEDVTFITIYPKGIYDEKATKFLNLITWDKVELAENDALYKQFKVENYPYYVLIDQIGYIVSAPALGPQPNGQYETIEKTFYFIHEINKKKN